MNEQIAAFVRTLLFFALVTGTAAVLIPLLVLHGMDTSGGIPTLGAPIVALGAALVLWSGYGFAFIGRGTPNPIDEPTRLVVWGPYRWVRNPIYVGAVTVVVGEAIASSLVLLAYAVIMWTLFHVFVVLWEEPHLTRRFGQSYLEYKRRVPRWIPRRPNASRR